jgi:hypothetical protein
LKDASASKADAAVTVTAAVAAATVAVSAPPTGPVFVDLEALQQGVARDLNTLADANGAPAPRVKALQRIGGVVESLSLELLAEASTSTLVGLGASCLPCHTPLIRRSCLE